MADEFDSSFPDSSSESFDSEPESMPELPDESEAAPEIEPMLEVESLPEPQPELNLTSEIASTPELPAEPEPSPEIEPTSEIQAEPESMPELQPEVDPMSEIESTLEVPAEPESLPEIEPTSEIQPESESMPELQPEVDPMSEIESTPELPAEPESLPEIEPTSEIQPESESTFKQQPEMNTALENQPEVEPTPEILADDEGDSKRSADERTVQEEPFEEVIYVPEPPIADSEAFSEQTSLLEESSPEKDKLALKPPEAQMAGTTQSVGMSSTTMAGETQNNAPVYEGNDPNLIETSNAEKNREYRIGSPHDDFRAYKNILQAENQHDLGVSAQTGDSPADAVSTLHQASETEDSTYIKVAEAYMESKYGSAPYTDAYPASQFAPLEEMSVESNQGNIESANAASTDALLQHEVENTEQNQLLTMPADMTTITDAQARDITIKRWGDDNLIQLRAYDTTSGAVPETANLGTAGMANLHIETSADGTTQVKLQDIVIPPEYRKSGIASSMLDQTVDIAKAKGASEIYGVVENDEALGYWKHMEEIGTGWKVDSSQGAHGYVRYDLNDASKKSPKVEISSTDSPTKSNSQIADIPISSSISSIDTLIKASDLNPKTIELLRKENLFDSKAVLSDNTGKNAERISQIIFSQQGLPDGNGGFIKFKQVVSGQYNDKNGIDLLGISEDGTPHSIEIKKRKNPAIDSMGADSFDPKNLEPETLELIKDIERERNVNPVLLEKYLSQQKNDLDPELSTEQMSDLWLRDRWLKLIKNDEKRSQLAQAGVAASFLDIDVLKVGAYSDTWKKILDSRNTVIVSQNKNSVTSRLFGEAVFKKKTNVTVIDLSN